MARYLLNPSEEIYIGLQVTYTQWKHKPDTLHWEYVGPYRTAAAAKGQCKNYTEHPVWDRNGYVSSASWDSRNQGLPEGRRRIDSVILKAEPNWTVV